MKYEYLCRRLSDKCLSPIPKKMYFAPIFDREYKTRGPSSTKVVVVVVVIYLKNRVNTMIIQLIPFGTHLITTEHI